MGHSAGTASDRVAAQPARVATVNRMRVLMA